jgi:hypothetical protein
MSARLNGTFAFARSRFEVRAVTSIVRFRRIAGARR